MVSLSTEYSRLPFDTPFGPKEKALGTVDQRLNGLIKHGLDCMYLRRDTDYESPSFPAKDLGDNLSPLGGQLWLYMWNSECEM